MRIAFPVRLGRRRRVLIVVSTVALAGSAVALAGTLTASTPVQVVDNPLAAGCAQIINQQAAAGSVNYPGAEVEPFVAVDPTNPKHLVASFQQDRWNDGGSNGLTNVVSTNGGASWRLASPQPAFSICEGATPGSAGYLNRATDPWVSFSSDGKIVYSISDSFNANGPAFGGASSIIVSRSTDGGRSWQSPVTARLDTSTTVLNDKESVTADPVKPATAYAVWDRLVSPQQNANPSSFTFAPAFRGPAMFSKTTDGGVTWSQGQSIFDPGELDQTIGNQIVVPTAGPAAGMLIDGFDLITNTGFSGSTLSVAIIRSADGGATWSQPIVAAQMDVAEVTINGQGVRTADVLPNFAVDPANGNLYAVWQDARFSAAGNAKVAFSMSSDGGLHWSAPIRIDQSPGDAAAFTPQVHVASNGTVGVTYYDLENATAGSPGLTDAFIVDCSSNCANPASWSANGETRLSTTGSFDMTTAPVANGFFVGDYEGLTSSGTIFDPFFVMAKPIATAGTTDPFASTAG